MFVHGSMQGAWCYSHWLKAVHEAGIAAVAIDVRGHGGWPNEDLFTAGFNEYGDDVAAIAQTFDHPPVLLGHSMGGLMVGVAATRTPVSGLVLLTHRRLQICRGAEAVSRWTKRALSPQQTKRLSARSSCRTMKARTSARCSERQCQKARSPRMIAINCACRLMFQRSIALRVSISAGRDWPLTHPPGQDAAVGAFYGAEHVHLPDAAHCLMIDVDWQPGLDVILEWYNRVFPA